MNGFSHILLDVHGAKLSKEERFYLRRIRDNVVLMEQLINDLLDLSRVGRVVGKRQTFSSRKVLEEIISSFYLQLQEKNIKIILPENLPQISGDRGRIVQVFKNLVHNAIKFTPAERGERIEILYKQTKNEHVFGIRDHGKGLDPKYQEKIFDLFYRLSNEEKNGTGIGLTIAKRIIEHHGGKIWVRSKPEHGSTFYFTLPK